MCSEIYATINYIHVVTARDTQTHEPAERSSQSEPGGCVITTQTAEHQPVKRKKVEGQMRSALHE